MSNWITIDIRNSNFTFTMSAIGMGFEIKFRNELVIYGGVNRLFQPSTYCPWRAYNDCSYVYYSFLRIKNESQRSFLR